ncbi:MAG: hypothetical protein WBL95_05735 [Microcoleus sp.]
MFFLIFFQKLSPGRSGHYPSHIFGAGLLTKSVIAIVLTASSRQRSYNQTGIWGNTDMSDLNRGIMKFKGADSPIAIAISAIVIAGGIGFLIWWALQSAYTLS